VGGRIGLWRGDQFAQNQSVNRRLAGLGFPALVAGVYDLSFLPLAHPPAVESPEPICGGRVGLPEHSYGRGADYQAKRQASDFLPTPSPRLRT